MNIRRVIFAGLMFALVGAMLGLAVSNVGQRIRRTRPIVLVGAGVGFGLGALSEAVRQQKPADDELEE